MKLGKDLSLAKYWLEQNGLVAIPTETVYGLGANGLNPDAVVKIYEAKGRPQFNPLILHVASLQQSKALVNDFSETALKLAEAFWPGPLTLILPAKDIVPTIVTAGLDTVGIRIPNHPLTLQLLQSLAFPVAAPSANPSGYISPTTAAHVSTQLGDKVDYILDGGACAVGVESTIVQVTSAKVSILRLGGITMEQIINLVGAENMSTNSNEKILAPGMTPSHYAPHKKVVVGNIESLLDDYPANEVAILSLQKVFGKVPTSNQLQLSLRGDLAEAAKNLFDYLHQLDTLPVKIILTEWMPNEGLGSAINDRLKRAAY